MTVTRQYYRPKEVAGLLNVSLATIYRMVEAGELPAIRAGAKLIRIPIEAFHQKFPTVPR